MALEDLELLRVEEGGKRWDTHTLAWIFQGIFVTLRAGEVAVLAGESGVGKSTFLRCLKGLEHFSQGTVWLQGNPQSEKKGMQNDVGMIFQEGFLFAHMSVFSNIRYPLIVAKKMDVAAANRKAQALLHRVGMEVFKDHYPHTLSGGQKQRVAIARALALDPLVLLCDEPTSALDAGNREGVLRALEDLCKRGKALVIVTHDPYVVQRMATKIWAFEGGTIRTYTKEEWYEHTPAIH